MRSTKTFAIAVAGVLAFSPLAACSGNPTAAEPGEETIEVEEEAGPSVSGTWTVSTKLNTNDSLTTAQRELFGRAYESYSERLLDPRVLLATRTDDGTDYAFLCTTRADQTDADSWAIATVHEPTSGKPSISKVSKIDLTRIATVPHARADFPLGGWEVADLDNTSIVDTAQVEEAGFSAALDQQDAVTYSPIALLGTTTKPDKGQLCLLWGTSESEDAPAKALYLQATFDSQPTVTEVFDLLAYV